VTGRLVATLAISLGLALAVGLGAIFLLAPGPFEMAAIKAREGQYREARTAYEALLAERGPKFEIVGPLANLYVTMGENEKAIALMTAYVNEHPGDLVALRTLATYLRDAQDSDNSVRVLVALAKASDDIGVLRELERLQDFRGEHAARAQTLLRIAQKGEASFAEFAELARLLAAQGDFGRAYAVMLKAATSKPQDVTVADAHLLAALGLAAGERDSASNALAGWARHQDDPRKIKLLADAIGSSGAPDLALRVVTESRAYANGDEMLRLEALMLQGEAYPEKVFEGLLARHRTEPLPPESLATLVETGFALGRYDETFAALETVQLASLPPFAQVLAVEEAAEHGRKDLLTRWRDEAGRDWSGLAPAASARLALAMGQTKTATALARRALEQAASDAERARIARVLADSGARAEALRAIDALGVKLARGDIAPDALRPLAEAALALNRTKIARAAGEQLAAVSKAPGDQALYALTLARSGAARQALAILERMDTHNPDIENAMVEALRQAGERRALQTFLYERLADANMSKQRRTDLLQALIESAPLASGAGVLGPGLAAELAGTGLTIEERRVRVRALALIDPSGVLPYARALALSKRPDDVILYADMLKRQGRRDEALAVLRGAAGAARGRQAKEDFVAALMELGGIEAALPLLADLAENEGGDWHHAYEDALRKLGRRDVLAAALVRRGADAATSDEDRKNIAYSLLDLGRKDDAESILRRAADAAGPASTEIDSLMWVWGPRPGPQAIEWMTAAARKARPEDRAAWVKRIAEAGAPRRAAQLADEFLQTTPDLGLLMAASRIHADLGDAQALDWLLVPAATRIDDADAARRLGRIAMEGGAHHAASLLFERAVVLEPKLIEGLAAAGIAAFYDGQASRARMLLSRYFAAGGHTPEARFAMAELDLQRNAFSRARVGYEATIAAADAHPKDDSLARLRALSLIRLKHEDEAFEAFQALLAAHPDDKSLRAGAAETFLDDDGVAPASHILGNTPGILTN